MQLKESCTKGCNGVPIIQCRSLQSNHLEEASNEIVLNFALHLGLVHYVVILLQYINSAYVMVRKGNHSNRRPAEALCRFVWNLTSPAAMHQHVVFGRNGRH
jgi:hypothetical protein